VARSRRPSSVDTGSVGGSELAVGREGVCMPNGKPRPGCAVVFDAGKSLTILLLAFKAEIITEFESAQYERIRILTCIIGVMRVLQSVSWCMWWPCCGGCGNGHGLINWGCQG